MTSYVDLQAKVSTIGCKLFEIQKRYMPTHIPSLSYCSRVFADSPKVNSRPAIAMNTQKRFEKKSTDADAIPVFNDATANAYQEWNVVKRNKFGRRQERVFGVDGKTVYNSKRGHSKGAGGVHTAERDINTLVKIEALQNDAKTFRIAWMEDKDVYNIEYTCDSTAECGEIVAKIRYILNRIRNKR